MPRLLGEGQKKPDVQRSRMHLIILTFQNQDYVYDKVMSGMGILPSLHVAHLVS